MAAGFEVRNPSGALQIDGTFQNLELRQVGSTTCDQYISGTNYWYREISLTTGGRPMLAIKDTGGASAFVLSGGVSGGHVTYRICRGSPGSVEWMLFDVPTPSGANFGLQVFNQDGALVFDALKKYARVLDVVAGSNMSTEAPIHRSYPGKSIAVVQGARASDQRGIDREGMGYYQVLTRGGRCAVGASNLSLTYELDSDFHLVHVFSEYQRYAYSYLVLDITNY